MSIHKTVEKEGLVRFGHCTCTAGLGEVCSQVGAILYALLAAVNKLSGSVALHALMWPGAGTILVWQPYGQ